MVRFVGLDVHKRLLVWCTLSPDGEVLSEGRLDEVTRAALAQFAARHLGPEDQLALEATTNAWAVVRALRPHVAGVTVSNPLATKAIAQAKVKTDRVDARVLAQLLRCGYLPTVWQPGPADERLREWTARRSRLVSQKTALANRLQATLAQRLLIGPHSLDTQLGRAWLSTVELDEDGRWLLDSDLRLLAAVEAELAAIDQELARRGHDDPRLKLLMTLPGVSQHTGQSLLAAIGDVSRFRDGRHLASYLGLVPSTRQSAAKCYHGAITKAGRGHTRWMLVQAAHSVRLHPGPLGHFFRRLKRKKNHNVAVVAVAHKLAILAWHVLTSGQPYRYALPRATEEKLAKLRVAATGQRRASGLGPGIDPRTVRGQGPRGRTQRGLSAVYANEGLPPAAPAPPGEQRFVQQQGLTAALATLETTQVRPRKTVPRKKPTPAN